MPGASDCSTSIVLCSKLWISEYGVGLLDALPMSLNVSGIIRGRGPFPLSLGEVIHVDYSNISVSGVCFECSTGDVRLHLDWKPRLIKPVET
jgi:hypothetical protein